MFGLGTSELIFIMLIATLLYGHRLPKVARNLGRSLNSFKQGMKEVDYDAEKDSASETTEND